MQRLEFGGGAADPVAECRAVDDDAVARQALRLPIERHVVRVFRYEHVGDDGFRRNAALDQTRGRRRLHDAGDIVGAGLFARAAGVLRAQRHEHTKPGGNLVEPLRAILADSVQGAAAARTRLRIGFDHDFLARQMCRQMAAVGFALACVRGLQCRVVLFEFRFFRCDRRLEVFEPEVQLIGIDLLGLAAEVRASQLSEKMAKPIALRALGQKQSLQRRDVIGQIFERQRHARRVADLQVVAPGPRCTPMWITVPLWAA